MSRCTEDRLPLKSKTEREKERRREGEGNYETCLGLCELRVVVSVEWTLRRRLCVCGHLVARQTFTCRVKQYPQNVNFFGTGWGGGREKGSRVSAGWHCIFGITLRGLKEVYEPKGVEKLSQLMEEQVILQLIWKHENCGNWSCEVFHPSAVTHRSIFKPRLGYGAR